MNLRRILHPIWRAPDVIIGGKDDPYLLRWHVIPRNRYFNIYLHKFLRDDDDRALHDHPWASVSVTLWGKYHEHLPTGRVKTRRFLSVVFRRAQHTHRIELEKNLRCDLCRRPHDEITYPALFGKVFLCTHCFDDVHYDDMKAIKRRRLATEYMEETGCFTKALIHNERYAKPAWTLFITGPKIREWGFHCPNGWRHWREFVEETDHGNIGRGCE